MRLTIDFPDGDSKVSEVLDVLVPESQLNGFLDQLEDPTNYVSVDTHTLEESMELIDQIKRFCEAKIPNHGNHCAAIRLRRESECDCVFGELRSLLHTEKPQR